MKMIQLSLTVLALLDVNYSYAQQSTEIVLIKKGTFSARTTAHSKSAAQIIDGASAKTSGITHAPRKEHPVTASAQNQADVVLRIVSFENVSDLKNLQEQLKSVSQTIHLAPAEEFAKNRQSECNSKPCVVVSDAEFAAMSAAKANGVLSYNFKEIAKRIFRDFNRTAATNASYKTAGLGNHFWSVYNPNPAIFYIPDGSLQSLGTYLPAAVAASISWSAVITNFYYEVSFVHALPTDLLMNVYYDDTSLGGTTIDESLVFNYYNYPAGYNTVTGWTTQFNGYHPDSFYSVRGYDNLVNLKEGYLDHLNFDVYWKDNVDYTPYTGAGANNVLSVSNNQVSVSSSVVNDSSVNGTTNIDLGWYISPKPQNGDCKDITVFDTFTAYSVSYNTIVGGLPANTFTTASAANINLSQVQNGLGAYMPPDLYCLWAYADDSNNEDETIETNNVYVFKTAFQFPTAAAAITQVGDAATTYTNPVQDNLSIKLGSGIQDQTVQILLVDTSGRIVVNKAYDGRSAIQLNMSSQPTGIYGLKIVGQNKNVILNEKITKQ